MSDSGDSILDLLQPRSSLTELSRPAALVESTVSAESDYVAFGHGRVGRRPQMMIAFRRCSGEIEVFPYSMLRKIQTEDPDRGFHLSFGETEVLVRGRGLIQLFRYVCEHRAVEMVEADRASTLGDMECLITEIRSEGR